MRRRVATFFRAGIRDARSRGMGERFYFEVFVEGKRIQRAVGRWTGGRREAGERTPGVFGVIGARREHGNVAVAAVCMKQGHSTEDARHLAVSDKLFDGPGAAFSVLIETAQT